LYDVEIADTAETIARLPLAPDDFCKKLATELTHKAVARAFDRDYFSPFAKAARRARRSYMGGRVDDISVVAAKAV
jgi:hypothetical protein